VKIDNFGLKLTNLFQPDLHALFTGEDCLLFDTGHRQDIDTIGLSHGYSPSESTSTGPSQVTYHAVVF
jgi:hypothetical protein